MAIPRIPSPLEGEGWGGGEGMTGHALFISAAHKSSGKTTFAMGLSRVLKGRGDSVQTFKKGPDYIDPMWLGRAAGQPCRNLDFYTQDHEEISATFQNFSALADISVIEGNKGLYDGVDTEGSDSNGALARLLGVPVLLVIDTYGITRGVAPLVKGYQDFEPDLNIVGVVLNKIGGSRHETKLRAAIERYTDMEVLGAVGRRPEMKIVERHLGLVPANEMPAADSNIARTARIIESEVDIHRVRELAAPAQPSLTVQKHVPKQVVASDIRIAIAKDAAFGFYYPDDLEALTAAGAELVPFDSLVDRSLPDVDGIFIGGGFPEVHLRMLEANENLRREIRQAIENGMPMYAECGGLMYLTRSLTWQGETGDMVGVIPADAVMQDRPVGRGYVRLVKADGDLWQNSEAGGEFPAHEFHYAALENLEPGQRFAYKVRRGHGVDGEHDGIIINNLLACFAHQRDIAANRWAERFVDFVRGVKVGRKEAALSA